MVTGKDCVPSMGTGIDCVPSIGAWKDCVPSIGARIDFVPSIDRLCSVNGTVIDCILSMMAVYHQLGLG